MSKLQCIKRVYILGAGASKGFGYPSVSDVLSIDYLNYIELEIKSLLDETPIISLYKPPPNFTLTDGPKPFFGEDSIDKLKAECEYFLKYGLKFEELMTYLEKKKDMKELNRLLNYYHKLLLKADDVILCKIPDNSFMNFIYKIFSGRSNSIISFNHDLFLEHTLGTLYDLASTSPDLGLNKDNFKNYNLGYSNREIKNFFRVKYPNIEEFTNLLSFLPVEYPTKGKIPILKLHGSLSLYECYNCKTIFYYPAPFLTPDDAEICPICKVKNWSRHFIVPPNCKDIHFSLKRLWKKALNEIRTADIIYIIGYSFPDYDKEAKKLFQYINEYNNKEIFIINKNIDNELKKRYTKIVKDPIFINGGFKSNLQLMDLFESMG